MGLIPYVYKHVSHILAFLTFEFFRYARAYVHSGSYAPGWVGSHFHDWIDYDGVALSIQLLEWGGTFSEFGCKKILAGRYKDFWSGKKKVTVLSAIVTERLSCKYLRLAIVPECLRVKIEVYTRYILTCSI